MCACPVQDDPDHDRESANRDDQSMEHLTSPYWIWICVGHHSEFRPIPGPPELHGAPDPRKELENFRGEPRPIIDKEQSWSGSRSLELANPDISKLHHPGAVLQGDRPARMLAVLGVCGGHAVEDHRQLVAAGRDVKRIPFSAR